MNSRRARELAEWHQQRGERPECEFAGQRSQIDGLNGLMDGLNAVVAVQQQLIGDQQVVIAELNEAILDQQVEIEQLRLNLGVMNSSLASLTSVVEQLLQATTFVPVVETTVEALVETTLRGRFGGPLCAASFSNLDSRNRGSRTGCWAGCLLQLLSLSW